MFTDADPEDTDLTITACIYIDESTCSEIHTKWTTQALSHDAADRRIQGIPEDITDAGTVTIRLYAYDGKGGTCADSPPYDEFDVFVNTNP